MKTKLNMALQMEDDNGNAELTTVDVYVSTTAKENLGLLKSGLQALCIGVHDIIEAKEV